MSNTLRDIISKYLPDWAKNDGLTPKERNNRLMEMKVKDLNEQEGMLKGADCRKCKNKGVIFVLNENYEMSAKNCECKIARNSLKLIEKSGLGGQLKDMTFEAFKTESEWQAVFKKIAQEFVKSPKGVFLAAGQSGAGKTHICTAISGELLKQNYPVKYMRWKDESTAIKAVIMDDDRYERLINPLKTIQVLYIDDFWKTKKNEEPKAGDINLAFEILNYRIGQKELITIISTEKTREELFDIDEAVAGRVFQFAGDFAVVIKPEKEKNYRRRDECK